MMQIFPTRMTIGATSLETAFSVANGPIVAGG